MATCRDVANYFLSKISEDAGDTISNLKLQKLVYYAQGFTLAVLEEPLFQEPIEAWEHGPVVRSLWEEFRQYGSGAIPQPQEFTPEGIFSADEIEILEDVNNVFGQYSAWKLRNFTHEEAPWLETPQNAVITHEIMKAFFKTQLQ